MASSLVFLGLSVVLFIIVYGFMFQIAAVVLGTVMTTLDNVAASMEINTDWETIGNEADELTRQLISLIMSLGIVILIIKVLMASGALGRD